MRAEVAAGAPATQIFYEAPHRILETLADIVAVFGAAQRVVLARELTKVHEEFLRGTGAQVLSTLQAREVVRGEFVLLLEPVTAEQAESVSGEAATLTLGEEVAAAIRGGLSEKDALKQVAKARGIGKSEAYREWQRDRSSRR
jgi:16S rRNA (cytidine1402-2'-O)-methyltransferase